MVCELPPHLTHSNLHFAEVFTGRVGGFGSGGGGVPVPAPTHVPPCPTGASPNLHPPFAPTLGRLSPTVALRATVTVSKRTNLQAPALLHPCIYHV